MKKAWKSVFALSAAGVAAIYLSGYGYIFKALKINLKKGALTPSSDDSRKFPYHSVATEKPETFEKDPQYNSLKFSGILYEELRKSRASSFLIIKKGKLLREQYWKNHDSQSLLNSFSMAKGFLSLLVGCAVDDGFFTSENQKISDFFPHYKDQKFGKHLMLKHLMTMQGGFDWTEEYRHPFAENSKQYFVEDLAKQVFETDLVEMPGCRYEYQSVSAQLLGLTIQKATGTSLAAYFSEKIWKPLQMEKDARWSIDEKGNEKAFCCVHASARDFAKIGQLILQKGKWKGKQIISGDFLEKMMLPTKENEAFGFCLWADDESLVKYRFFYGFLGQFIIIIPEKELVIVKTGLYNRLEVDEKKRPLQVKLFVEEVLKSLEHDAEKMHQISLSRQDLAAENIFSASS